MIKVFVQNLRKYNEGILSGNWVTLPIDEEDLEVEVNKVLGADEEYCIGDNESPFNIGIYDNIFELNQFLSKVSNYTKNLEVIELLMADNHCNYDEVISILEKGKFRIFNASTMEEVAIEIIEDTIPGWEELPTIIHDNFSFESYGETLESDGTWLQGENVIIELF